MARFDRDPIEVNSAVVGSNSVGQPEQTGLNHAAIEQRKKRLRIYEVPETTEIEADYDTFFAHVIDESYVLVSGHFRYFPSHMEVATGISYEVAGTLEVG